MSVNRQETTFGSSEAPIVGFPSNVMTSKFTKAGAAKLQLNDKLYNLTAKTQGQLS